MTSIETARLYLRRLQAADADEYYQCIYADPDVMRTLPPFGPISRAEFNICVPTFMVEPWAVHGFGPWAVLHKSDNQCIGHCGLRYAKTFQLHGLTIAGYSLSRTDYRADDAQYRLVLCADE